MANVKEFNKKRGFVPEQLKPKTPEEIAAQTEAGNAFVREREKLASKQDISSKEAGQQLVPLEQARLDQRLQEEEIRKRTEQVAARKDGLPQPEKTKQETGTQEQARAEQKPSIIKQTLGLQKFETPELQQLAAAGNFQAGIMGSLTGVGRAPAEIQTVSEKIMQTGISVGESSSLVKKIFYGFATGTGVAAIPLGLEKDLEKDANSIKQSSAEILDGVSKSGLIGNAFSDLDENEAQLRAMEASAFMLGKISLKARLGFGLATEVKIANALKDLETKRTQLNDLFISGAAQ